MWLAAPAWHVSLLLPLLFVALLQRLPQAVATLQHEEAAPAGLPIANSTIRTPQWDRDTSSAPWTARFGHCAVVVQNRTFLMGGVTESGAMNDVWATKTSHGDDWTLVAQFNAWVQRAQPACTVLNNRMWLMVSHRH